MPGFSFAADLERGQISPGKCYRAQDQNERLDEPCGARVPAVLDLAPSQSLAKRGPTKRVSVSVPDAVENLHMFQKVKGVAR